MKKTIKFFAMLALVSAVAFVACSKDDEENSSVSSAIQVTFGDEVVPLGWHNFTYDGQYFDIEAAQGYEEGTKDAFINVTLPYVDVIFTEEGIFDAYYSENSEFIYNRECEWRYDDEGDQDFTINGLDLTKLSLTSASAYMTMYDYWYDNVDGAEERDDQTLTVTATNLKFSEIAKGAKKSYNFHK